MSLRVFKTCPTHGTRIVTLGPMTFLHCEEWYCDEEVSVDGPVDEPLPTAEDFA